MVKQIQWTSLLLEELGQLEELPAGELEEELQETDRLILAEAAAVADDEAWIAQTLELLNSVDEEPDIRLDEESAEDLLKELEALDQAELASS